MSTDTHAHRWQNGGHVRVNRCMHSPVSQWADALWADVMLVQACECGAVRRVKIGEENHRSRGDDLRAGRIR